MMKPFAHPIDFLILIICLICMPLFGFVIPACGFFIMIGLRWISGFIEWCTDRARIRKALEEAKFEKDLYCNIFRSDRTDLIKRGR